eukprot:2449919-Pleurochrysis_carterae.AAC.2
MAAIGAFSDLAAVVVTNKADGTTSKRAVSTHDEKPASLSNRLALQLSQAYGDGDGLDDAHGGGGGGGGGGGDSPRSPHSPSDGASARSFPKERWVPHSQSRSAAAAPSASVLVESLSERDHERVTALDSHAESITVYCGA